MLAFAWLMIPPAAASDPPPPPAWAAGPARVAAAEVSPGVAMAELRPGTGEALRPGDVAVVSYVGWLDDGSVWDSTLERSVPTLPPGTVRMRIGDRRVPAAWSEGLAGMRVGGVRQLVLRDPDADPAEGPVPTLTLAVELVEVQVPPALVLPAARAVRRVGELEAIDLVAGEGEPVAPGARVWIDYVLRLPDGTEIDSSWRWPEPFGFRIGRSPPVRWAEALVGMRAGGRRQVTLPASAAFGSEGRPPLVPPEATLLLTVDLRRVEP